MCSKLQGGAAKAPTGPLEDTDHGQEEGREEEVGEGRERKRSRNSSLCRQPASDINFRNRLNFPSRSESSQPRGRGYQKANTPAQFRSAQLSPDKPLVSPQGVLSLWDLDLTAKPEEFTASPCLVRFQLETLPSTPSVQPSIFLRKGSRAFLGLPVFTLRRVASQRCPSPQNLRDQPQALGWEKLKRSSWRFKAGGA